MTRVRTFDNLIRRVAWLIFALALVSAPQVARAQNVCALPGNDNIATLSGVINTYYPGAANASAGALSIQVGAARFDGAAVPITSGDLLLVIQMQDATINTTNGTNYGGSNGTGRGAAINNSGLYEYVVATNTIGLGANTVSIRGTGGGGGLRNAYTTAAATGTQGQRKFQVIRVPQYASAALTSGLTAAPWDHVTGTGGVLAFDVAGALALSSATVSVNGRGFRGGGGRPLSGGRVNNIRINQNIFDYVYPTSSPLSSTVGAHGTKGEGIAGTPRYIYDRATDTVIENTSGEGYPGGSNARGAPGNAGGGGADSAGDTNNEANSGGGGGGNGGIGGGGGNTWRDNAAIGGIGGAAVANSATRVVMGGGGGAGSRNNSVDTDSSGAAGGGIVFIRTGSVSGTGTITAHGDAAINDTANDGGGGGGAGGSVIVTSGNTLAGLTIRALGGRGGDAWRSGGTSQADRHGPGGGGAGGFIAYTAGANIPAGAVTGGTSGLTTTLADAYSATAGGTGVTLPIQQTDVPGIRSGGQCLPALTVTKTTSTANVTNTPTGTTATYTITVSNAADRAPATSVSLSDALPASFTYKTTGTITFGGGATRPTVTDPTLGATNPAWSSFTIPASGQVQLTFTVDIASSVATGTYQNPATATYLNPARTVAGGTTASNYNPATSTGEDVNVTSYPDLTIAKTHTGNFTLGSTGLYSITVTNAGSAATTGATVTVTDTLPAGLTVASVSAPSGWNCSTTVIGSGTATCTSTSVVAAGQPFPVISLTVNVATNAAASVTNSVSVAGGGETNAANNTATDPTTINRVPDVRIAKSHTGNFTVGTNGSYTLTASNAGGLATSGTITVVDNLPTGLTVASVPVIPNWDCSTTVVGSSTLTCTSTTVILAGTNHSNAILLDVVVSAAAFAASPVTNVANISGGGEPAFNNGNNSASDPTTINGAPDLSITKTHAGNFTRGSTTDAYTITVTNSGTAATTGATVTVTDTLPAGLTPTAPTGLVNGWTCSINLQVVTCTRANALAVGQSYPVINVIVTVSQTAAASVTNSVTVAGGGEPASLNGNNTATDPTTIISRADLSLTKTADNAAPLVNQLVTFTLTVTNAGPTNTTGVAVRDLLPAGLSFVSANPAAAYNSATGIWTVGNLNSGANSTLQIVARVTTSGAITNTAEVNASAVTDPDSTPNNNVAAEDDQASVMLGVPVPPDVRLQKRCTAPANCESAPQQPGTELTYTITFTNTAGTSAAQGLTIVDIIPVTDNGSALIRNTEFKVGSMTFSPGTTGLTILPTDYKYYNDPLAVYPLLPPWTPSAAYTPTGAFDYNVTYIAWKLTGSMPPGTSGSVTFTVRIR